MTLRKTSPPPVRDKGLQRWLDTGGSLEDWTEQLNGAAREAMASPRPSPPDVTPVRGHGYVRENGTAWCACGRYLGGLVFDADLNTVEHTKSVHQLHLIIVKNHEKKRTNEMALRGASERTGPDIGPWFYASFASECGGCFLEIYQGDRARYVEGVVVCEECGEEADDAA